MVYLLQIRPAKCTQNLEGVHFVGLKIRSCKHEIIKTVTINGDGIIIQLYYAVAILDCLYNSTSRKYTPSGYARVVQYKGYKCGSDHCSDKQVSFVPTFQDYYILLLFLYQSYKITRFNDI